MGTFGAAPHHEILLLLIQLAVLLATARLLGEVCLRYGQPAVIGELGAGILLGPSVLSGLVPIIGAHIVPHTQTQGYILEVVSMLGALFLLLITGLETDIPLIRRHLRTAMGVSIGGITCTFLSGLALGMMLPDDLLANPSRRVVFALFMATAMSISAIPVIAKVLMDLNLMRRDVGQTILAAGMSDDTTGWVLLSIVAALAGGTTIGVTQVGWAVGKVLIFMVLSFTVGRWAVQKALRSTQDNIQSRDRLITLVMVTALSFGAFAQALELEAVLGAFVAGILFSTMPRLPKDVGHFFESVALGLFAPIFFAVAGLKVDIKGLMEPRLMGYTLAIIAVACGGKFLGTYLGARLIGGKDHWTALSFGSGLNARGAMEIIIATIGLQLGILTQATFSMIVVMALVTSLMAPTALRFTLARVQLSEEERLRLDREEQASRNWLSRVKRVLIPIRYRPEGGDDLRSFEETVFAKLASSAELSVTIITVVPPGQSAVASAWLAGIAKDHVGNEIIPKVVESSSPVETILDEAKKDYQLLILGATETIPNQESLFSPAIDDLVRLSPCSTMVLRAGRVIHDVDFRRILVPTNGGTAAKRAADLAFMLASGYEDHHVEFLRVMVRTSEQLALDTTPESRGIELEQAHHALSELVRTGEGLGVPCGSEIRTAESPASKIIELAEKPNRVDLVILGTDVRPGGRLFLGPSVERVLKHCRASVIVVNE